MRVALLNDSHFGARNDSHAFLQYFFKFFDKFLRFFNLFIIRIGEKQ